jgi:hypothetical protein
MEPKSGPGLKNLVDFADFKMTDQTNQNVEGDSKLFGADAYCFTVQINSLPHLAAAYVYYHRIQ